ncbi:hypothetical protein IWQ56_004987 [Coemansia nantahalensis]|nr:hypothetical protein IWQ56_004987 [Coemansia nantahalensis]
MALNAVMLEEGTRHPVPLPNENFLYHCSGVRFELKSGDGFPGDAVALRDASGTAFVSNQRVVYLPATTTHASSTASSPRGALNSYSVPHTSLKELKFVQPLFGANRFEALALPVAGGSFAGCATLVLAFKDGGGFDFATIARKMGEQIQATGVVPPHEEDLPVYDDGCARPGPSSPPGYPADPPPGYQPPA